MGFSARWRDWISLLLASASSSVLLNGAAGRPILHRHGLRQGDPISPLLFILALDPLHRILEKATMLGAVSPLPVREARLCTSLYADDAIIFLNPARQEVVALLQLLQSFGSATGLQINVAKCVVSTIRCEGLELDDILQPFEGERATFPIKYLSLPLTLGRLLYVHLQPILDRARSHLAAWRGKWVNVGGRKQLVSSVLSTLSIFAMTMLKLPLKFIKDIDRLRRNFTWDIHDDAPVGSKYKIS
ncbi:hypothetical protein ACQ4PT_036950 [Festuca glaucescens]